MTSVGQATTQAGGRVPGTRGDWVGALGRAGLAAKGALYVIIGVLALRVAFGDLSQLPSQQGAVEWVARQPLGRWLLVLLAVGLLALAVWRLVDAVRGDPVEGEEAADRVGYAVKAAVYLPLALSTAAVAAANWGKSVGGGSGGSGGGSQQATAVVLDWPGGRWIVAAVGLAVAAYGVKTFWNHAVQAGFMGWLRTGEMSPSVRDAVEKVGRGGYTARALILLLVGWFLVDAALSHDPQEAVGLSGALRQVAEAPWGPWLLGAVAVGLFLYGLLNLVLARYRRMA